MDTVAVQGARVPALGLGTWTLTGRECYRAVSTALEEGYRHVDTAAAYGNERQVGRAIADAAVDREDVFVTTKLMPGDAAYDDAMRAAEASLDRLGLASVDLLLLHWPTPLVPIRETTTAFADLRESGRIRYAGVSNFSLRRLRRARSRSPVPLLADQVQLHPYRSRRRLLRYCQEEDLLLTAYSPLAHGGVLEDDVLAAIAAKYEVTPAQVALRWAVQHHNVAVIPRSSSPEHIAENAAIFAFTLSADEIERIRRDSLVRTGLAWLRALL